MKTAKCEYCEKDVNVRGIGPHRRGCAFKHGIGEAPRNAKRTQNGEAYIPWNKGKTKSTDDRVAQAAAKQIGADRDKSYITDEFKERISQQRKEFFLNNPERHPNRLLANNRTKISYPEQVAFDWLTRNQIHFEHQFPLNGWFVDFRVGNLLIEIDGAHWHNAENDAIKDAWFTSNGFTILRIAASEHIEQRLAEIHNMFQGEFGVGKGLDPITPHTRKIADRKAVLEKKLASELEKLEAKQQIIDERIELIKNSNIDFQVYGWVGKVGTLLGVSPTQVRRWMLKNMPEFFSECSQRKPAG